MFSHPGLRQLGEKCAFHETRRLSLCCGFLSSDCCACPTVCIRLNGSTSKQVPFIQTPCTQLSIVKNAKARTLTCLSVSHKTLTFASAGASCVEVGQSANLLHRSSPGDCTDLLNLLCLNLLPQPTERQL